MFSTTLWLFVSLLWLSTDFFSPIFIGGDKVNGVERKGGGGWCPLTLDYPPLLTTSVPNPLTPYLPVEISPLLEHSYPKKVLLRCGFLARLTASTFRKPTICKNKSHTPSAVKSYANTRGNIPQVTRNPIMAIPRQSKE